MAERRRRSTDWGSSARRPPSGNNTPRYEERIPRAAATEYLSSSGSSSSSYLDISHTYPARLSGITSFFTTPSERRVRRRRSRASLRHRRNSSSSSSLNEDLAYGNGYLKKPKRPRGVRSRTGRSIDREREREYNRERARERTRSRERRSSTDRERQRQRPGLGSRITTDAEILAVGAGLAKLARDQNRGESSRNGYRPEILTVADTRSPGASRGLGPSKEAHEEEDDDDGWEDEDSEVDSESSVDSKLAFGYESDTGFFGWGGKSIQKPPRPRLAPRKSSIVDPRLFGPANSLHGYVDHPVGYGEVEGILTSGLAQQRQTYAPPPPPGEDREKYPSYSGPPRDRAQRRREERASLSGPRPSLERYDRQTAYSSYPAPNRENSVDGSQAPMQVVYPIPTEDPSQFEVARSSASGPALANTSKQSPIPIQQPQPFTPVSQKVYDPRPESASKPGLARTDSGGILKKSGRPSLAQAALMGIAGAAVVSAIASGGDERKGDRKEERSSRDETSSASRRDQGKTDSKKDREREKHDSPERSERREKRREKEHRKDETKTSRSEISSRDKKRDKRRDQAREESKEERRERKRLEENRSSHDSEIERPTNREAEMQIARVVDPFQFQLADDAPFPSPKVKAQDDGYTVVTVDREPEFSRQYGTSINEQRAFSGRDDQGLRQNRKKEERTLQDAEKIYRDTEHSTAPIEMAAIGAAVAAVAAEGYRESRSEKRRGERRSEYESQDYHGPHQEREKIPQQDLIQEEADKAYREIVLARKVAAEVRRSRSPSPGRSIVYKYEESDEDNQVQIVTPPEMQHRKSKGPYDAPDADFIPDAVIKDPRSPTFHHENYSPNPHVLKRDPGTIKPRPILNLVRPTPASTPSLERQMASSRSEDRNQVRPFASEHEPSGYDSPTASAVSKGVTWGDNHTRHFEVVSPDDHRDEFISEDEVLRRSDASQNPASRAWGAVAAAGIAAGTAAAISSGISDIPRSKDKEVDKHHDLNAAAPYEYRGVVVEPETPVSPRRRSPPQRRNPWSDEDPPSPGPKPISPVTATVPHIPGAFDDDLEFTATLAAGLKDTGFDPNIVIDDPLFRKRVSSPGSEQGFSYRVPYAETVTDVPSVVGASSEPGFIIGEVPETPKDWQSISPEEAPVLSKKEQKKRDKAARAQSGQMTPLEEDSTYATPMEKVEEPASYFEPKLSKKEQKKRDKALKRESSSEKSIEEPLPVTKEVVEEPESYIAPTPDRTEPQEGKSSKRGDRSADSINTALPSDKTIVQEPESYFETVQTPLKSKKKKASTFDNEPLPQSPLRTVSVPIDAFEDVQNDEWGSSPVLERSKRDSNAFESPAASAPNSGDELSRSSSKKGKSKRDSKRDSKQDSKRTESPTASAWNVVDKLSRSSSKKRDSSVVDSPDVSAPNSDVEGSSASRRSSSRRKSRHEDTQDPSGIALPPATPSEIAREEVESPRRTRTSSTRDGDDIDHRDRSRSIARSITSTGASKYDDGESRKHRKKSRSGTQDDFDDTTSVVSSKYDDDESRKHRKKSRSSTHDDFDDTRSVASSKYDDEESGKHRKKSRNNTQDALVDNESSKGKPKEKRGGFFGLFSSSKSQSSSREQSPKPSPSRDEFEESSRKGKKKRSSTTDQSELYSGIGSQSVGDLSSLKSNGNGSRHDFEDMRPRSDVGKKSRGSDSKEESFLGEAGILGAGVGIASAALAIAAQHSNADNANTSEYLDFRKTLEPPDSSEQHRYSDSQAIDPEIHQRQFRPAIDPHYGDLLPLPPSDPTSPNIEPLPDLPQLPESRPDTPEAERRAKLGKGLHRSRKSIENPPKSPSQSAVPLKFGLGSRSIPTSPLLGKSFLAGSLDAELSPARTRGRPTSWDSTREVKPLYLLESNRRSSGQVREDNEALPELPISRETSRSSSQLDLNGESKWHQHQDDMEQPNKPLMIDTALASTMSRDDVLGSEQSTPKAAVAGQHAAWKDSTSPAEMHGVLGSSATDVPEIASGALFGPAAKVVGEADAPILGYTASTPAENLAKDSALYDLPSILSLPPSSPVDPMANKKSLPNRPSPTSKLDVDGSGGMTGKGGHESQNVDEERILNPRADTTVSEPAAEFSTTLSKKKKGKKGKAAARASAQDDFASAAEITPTQIVDENAIAAIQDEKVASNGPQKDESTLDSQSDSKKGKDGAEVSEIEIEKDESVPISSTKPSSTENGDGSVVDNTALPEIALVKDLPAPRSKKDKKAAKKARKSNIQELEEPLPQSPSLEESGRGEELTTESPRIAEDAAENHGDDPDLQAKESVHRSQEELLDLPKKDSASNYRSWGSLAAGIIGAGAAATLAPVLGFQSSKPKDNDKQHEPERDVDVAESVPQSVFSEKPVSDPIRAVESDSKDRKHEPEPAISMDHNTEAAQMTSQDVRPVIPEVSKEDIIPENSQSSDPQATPAIQDNNEPSSSGPTPKARKGKKGKKGKAAKDDWEPEMMSPSPSQAAPDFALPEALVENDIAGTGGELSPDNAKSTDPDAASSSHKTENISEALPSDGAEGPQLGFENGTQEMKDANEPSSSDSLEAPRPDTDVQLQDVKDISEPLPSESTKPPILEDTIAPADKEVSPSKSKKKKGKKGAKSSVSTPETPPDTVIQSNEDASQAANIDPAFLILPDSVPQTPTQDTLLDTHASNSGTSGIDDNANKHQILEDTSEAASVELASLPLPDAGAPIPIQDEVPGSQASTSELPVDSKFDQAKAIPDQSSSEPLDPQTSMVDLPASSDPIDVSVGDVTGVDSVQPLTQSSIKPDALATTAFLNEPAVSHDLVPDTKSKKSKKKGKKSGTATPAEILDKERAIIPEENADLSQSRNNIEAPPEAAHGSVTPGAASLEHKSAKEDADELSDVKTEQETVNARPSLESVSQQPGDITAMPAVQEGTTEDITPESTDLPVVPVSGESSITDTPPRETPASPIDDLPQAGSAKSKKRKKDRKSGTATPAEESAPDLSVEKEQELPSETQETSNSGIDVNEQAAGQQPDIETPVVTEAEAAIEDEASKSSKSKKRKGKKGKSSSASEELLSVTSEKEEQSTPGKSDPVDVQEATTSVQGVSSEPVVQHSVEPGADPEGGESGENVREKEVHAGKDTQEKEKRAEDDVVEMSTAKENVLEKEGIPEEMVSEKQNGSGELVPMVIQEEPSSSSKPKKKKGKKGKSVSALEEATKPVIEETQLTTESSGIVQDNATPVESVSDPVLEDTSTLEDKMVIGEESVSPIEPAMSEPVLEAQADEENDGLTTSASKKKKKKKKGKGASMTDEYGTTRDPDPSDNIDASERNDKGVVDSAMPDPLARRSDDPPRLDSRDDFKHTTDPDVETPQAPVSSSQPAEYDRTELQAPAASALEQPTPMVGPGGWPITPATPLAVGPEDSKLSHHDYFSSPSKQYTVAEPLDADPEDKQRELEGVVGKEVSQDVKASSEDAVSAEPSHVSADEGPARAIGQIEDHVMVDEHVQEAASPVSDDHQRLDTRKPEVSIVEPASVELPTSDQDQALLDQLVEESTMMKTPVSQTLSPQSVGIVEPASVELTPTIQDQDPIDQLLQEPANSTASGNIQQANVQPEDKIVEPIGIELPLSDQSGTSSKEKSSPVTPEKDVVISSKLSKKDKKKRQSLLRNSTLVDEQEDEPKRDVDIVTEERSSKIDDSDQASNVVASISREETLVEEAIAQPPPTTEDPVEDFAVKGKSSKKAKKNKGSAKVSGASFSVQSALEPADTTASVQAGALENTAADTGDVELSDGATQEVAEEAKSREIGPNAAEEPFRNASEKHDVPWDKPLETSTPESEAQPTLPGSGDHKISDAIAGAPQGATDEQADEWAETPSKKSKKRKNKKSAGLSMSIEEQSTALAPEELPLPATPNEISEYMDPATIEQDDAAPSKDALPSIEASSSKESPRKDPGEVGVTANPSDFEKSTSDGSRPAAQDSELEHSLAHANTETEIVQDGQDEPVMQQFHDEPAPEEGSDHFDDLPPLANKKDQLKPDTSTETSSLESPRMIATLEESPKTTVEADDAVPSESESKTMEDARLDIESKAKEEDALPIKKLSKKEQRAAEKLAKANVIIDQEDNQKEVVEQAQVEEDLFPTKKLSKKEQKAADKLAKSQVVIGQEENRDEVVEQAQVQEDILPTKKLSKKEQKAADKLAKTKTVTDQHEDPAEVTAQAQDDEPSLLTKKLSKKEQKAADKLAKTNTGFDQNDDLAEITAEAPDDEASLPTKKFSKKEQKAADKLAKTNTGFDQNDDLAENTAEAQDDEPFLPIKKLSKKEQKAADKLAKAQAADRELADIPQSESEPSTTQAVVLAKAVDELPSTSQQSTEGEQSKSGVEASDENSPGNRELSPEAAIQESVSAESKSQVVEAPVVDDAWASSTKKNKKAKKGKQVTPTTPNAEMEEQPEQPEQPETDVLANAVAKATSPDQAPEKQDDKSVSLEKEDEETPSSIQSAIQSVVGAGAAALATATAIIAGTPLHTESSLDISQPPASRDNEEELVDEPVKSSDLKGKKNKRQSGRPIPDEDLVETTTTQIPYAESKVMDEVTPKGSKDNVVALKAKQDNNEQKSSSDASKQIEALVEADMDSLVNHEALLSSTPFVKPESNFSTPSPSASYDNFSSSLERKALKKDKRKRQATTDLVDAKDFQPSSTSWAVEVAEAEKERDHPIIEDIAKDDSLAHIASTVEAPPDDIRPNKKGKRGIKRNSNPPESDSMSRPPIGEDLPSASSMTRFVEPEKRLSKKEKAKLLKNIDKRSEKADIFDDPELWEGKDSKAHEEVNDEDDAGSDGFWSPRNEEALEEMSIKEQAAPVAGSTAEAIATGPITFSHSVQEPIDLSTLSKKSQIAPSPSNSAVGSQHERPGSSSLAIVREEPDLLEPEPRQFIAEDANRDSAFVTGSPQLSQSPFVSHHDNVRDSGIHVKDESPVPREPIAASDAAIERLAWPALDEETETVDLQRSQRVQTSDGEHHDHDTKALSPQALEEEYHTDLQRTATVRRTHSPRAKEDKEADLLRAQREAASKREAARSVSKPVAKLEAALEVSNPDRPVRKPEKTSLVRQRLQQFESPDLPQEKLKRPPVSTPELSKEEKYKELEPKKRPRAEQPKVDLGTGAAIAAAGLGFAAARKSSQENRPDSAQSQRSTSNISTTAINRLRTPEYSRPESVNALRSGSASPVPSLRRTGHKNSGDLRSLSQQNLAKSPASAQTKQEAAEENRSATSASSANNANPTANEGRVRAKEMADVYDGLGEGRMGSPRSPTRPHSMRRRQSMQVLDLETKVEQLAAENQALAEFKTHAELMLQTSQPAVLAERNAEIDTLKRSLEFIQDEVRRLTEINEGLTSANVTLGRQHNDRYGALETRHAQAARELLELREAQAAGNEGERLIEQDQEIANLRAQLEVANAQIREMQRQILASKSMDNTFLNVRDEDYFDAACQQLCQHVQQWVLRFSKFSDMRACRPTSEINNDKIIDRLDNAILDGSDVDTYLADRVKRRDVFMSMTMTMVWDFIFTRYLFGMDREQRQKLKALEKLLSDIGPASAVHQWRAITLTLLSRRPAFTAQREQDTLAVVHAILETLTEILPPPSHLEAQIEEQLKRVMTKAVELSIEMRTQRAEYMMLPPLQPEYDANGDLASKVSFNAALMNERSGDAISNEELQKQKAIVRIVLFPLVVKKGDDSGEGDEEIVVCPAQVLVQKGKRVRVLDPDRMMVDGDANRSRQSLQSMQSSMPPMDGSVV